MRNVHADILGTIGWTPLVHINRITAGQVKGTVLAKLETFNPGNSTKDRMAVRMIEDVGINKAVSYAEKIGVPRIPRVPSAALGAGEVTLETLTSAYAVFATGGISRQPLYVLRVEDARGKVVWEHKDYEQKRVVDGSVAWLMNDILKDTTQPSRSYVFGSWTNIGRPAALKTGTTDNLKDVYSVGYVPTLVTGVWMGNSNGDPMSSRDFSSAMGPGQLWAGYMKEVLAETPVSDWQRPANVVSGTVVVSRAATAAW